MGKKHKKKKKKWWEEQRTYNYYDRNNEFGSLEHFPYETLAFAENAYKRLFYYARAATGEISGFGRTVANGKELMVTEVLLFKQVCSAGGTTLDAKALADFILQLVKEGRDPSEYKLWWHTHSDFGTFWSGTDESTARELSKETLVACVEVNKSGEMIARLDERNRHASIPIVIKFADKRVEKICIEEVKAKVKENRFLSYLERKELKKDGYYRKTKDYANPYTGFDADQYAQQRKTREKQFSTDQRLLPHRNTANYRASIAELAKRLESRGYKKTNGVWRYVGRGR